MEVEVVVEFLGRVVERFRGAPQIGARRGVVDDHAVFPVLPVGRVGGPGQREGGLCDLGEVRCCVARQGGRLRQMGEYGAADAVHAVGGPGEVGGQLDDVAEEGLRIRGVLEQVGVCRRGGDVTGVVQ
ncbi:hypothetical protein ABZ498_00700 [Streptomyces lavendulocolor]|uniref:hypothetical protein n=1 Tax=Streptomyces lavendulocolor TaxID=67316 RepID=UPI003400A7BF